jgi:hypothetical protein
LGHYRKAIRYLYDSKATGINLGKKEKVGRSPPQNDSVSGAVIISAIMLEF